MICPLCDSDCRDAPRCWSCGYDFEHRDARHAIARIRKQMWKSNAMWLGGMGLLFIAPALVFQTGLIAAGLLAGTICATSGIVCITFGLISGDRAKKQLVQATQRTQLPAARVVE